MNNTLTAADLDELEKIHNRASEQSVTHAVIELCTLAALLALARKGLECDADRTTYLRVLAAIDGERNALAAELAELQERRVETVIMCEQLAAELAAVNARLLAVAGERDAQAAELAELRKACAALMPLIESVNRNNIPDQVPLGIDIERVGGAPTVGDLRRIDAAFALTLLSELESKS